VVDFKCSEWLGDQKMFKNLNPTTLFRPGHWDTYLADARQWADKRLRPSIKSVQEDVDEIVEGLLG
jgi:hypothetical protein